MSSLFPDILRPLPLLLLLSLLASVSPGSVHAGELRLVPALSLKGEYNDNVFASASGRRADYVTGVSPSLTLARRSETGQAAVTGGANALYYLRDTREGDLGYFARGAGSFRASSRLSLETDLDFTRDAGASFLDPATSQLVGSKSERQAYRAGGSYRLSEHALTSVDLAFSRYDYDTPSYQDTSYYQGGVSLRYLLGPGNPGSWLAPQLSYRRDDTDLSRVENVSSTVGLSGQMNELWRATLSAGGRFTRSEIRGAGSAVPITVSDRGWVGSGALAYSGETGAGTLSISHTLAPASGQSGARQLTETGVTLSRRFTGRLSGNLSAGYTRSRSAENQFSPQAVDERSRNASGALLYRILEAPRDLSLEARYSYHSTKYRITGAEVLRNTVMLQLTWQHEMFR